MSYKSINPATGKLLNSYSIISDDELQEKIICANDVFKYWRKTELDYRKMLLLKVADLLESEKEIHAGNMTAEMGKPINQSIAEVEKSALVCRYYAENAKKFLEPERKKSSAKESYIKYEPIGVIYAVMPWNFPYWQVFRFIAPNFILGNTGLLKHASNVPACALAIEKLFIDAGAKKGIFQNLFINYHQSEEVVKNQYVRGVTLTGSNYAGSKVAELAGKYIKKSVLELGGSDPFLIFEDADIEEAVKYGIISRFLNAGQSCIAAKRFIVHNKIYDKFINIFKRETEKLKTGDPMNSDNYIGPMAKESFVIELEEQVNKSVEMGAKIITGGKRKKSGTCYYLPTIIDNIPENAPLANEEIFGPVAPVFEFNDYSEAVKIANNTPFGLGATVWTKDIDKAKKIADEIVTGTVAINGMVKSEPGLPFGGVKDSGYGRELSEYGLKEFANIKTINIF
ncbi:MAG: NAD-dependent succinate-semialdehyde dehydrogenase [Bacteroidales bacterium]|nr:NAD-dependent succinate-semialdehyde dehydrogenase [Bacteroidales bacterium]